MTQVNEIFFTSVGCMDGRVQNVIAQFGLKKFGATYPDTITEAGLVGLLARTSVNQTLLDAINFKAIAVSVGKHNSKGIIVHGHAECAGNPVSDQQQREDISQSVTVLKSLAGDIEVMGAFVHRDSKNPAKWVIEELA